MNQSLSDINRSLTESKSKMKNDFERSLRGLNFGKLYLKNGEFETALKYVKTFLSVRPNSSEGHKLLAQIYEAIGDDDTALLNYRKALDLKKNSNENYLSSIEPSMSSSSMSQINRNVENNIKPSMESTPIHREMAKENHQNNSHPCSTCSNQTILNKICKQNESLMETNKLILDTLKRNTCDINDIQKQINSVTESLNNLTDSQNVMKDDLYNFIAQEEQEGFDEYLLDDKENESLDTSALLGDSINQSNQWHSSGLQLMPIVDQNKPLSELFKPAADSWQCDACYVSNKGSETKCVSCETPKPGVTIEELPAQEAAKTTFGFGNAQPFSFKAPNASNTSSGFIFGSVDSTVETNTIFSNTNFKFGNNTFNSSLSSATNPPQFGLQSTLFNDVKSPQIMFGTNPNSNESKLNSFNFGLNQSFDFELPKFVKEEPIKPSEIISGEKPSNEREEETTNLNDSFVEPSNADSIYFQPVVPLPPKIEVKTGEEEERVIHCCRARLFRFFDNEWKERGVGELKILENSDSTRIRLLMRRDTIFKVCLNQSITPDLKIELKEDKKSITWSAIDYSEDTPNPQIFLLRLKNAENAQLFINAIEMAKSGLNTNDSSKISPQSTPIPTKITQKESEPQIENTKSEESNESLVNSKDDEIEIVYQKMPESEEILNKVKKLQLPLNFYDYENMMPCPGCRGCTDDYPLFSNSVPKRVETDTIVDTTQQNLFHSAIAATNISPSVWKKNSEQQLWQTNAPTPLFSGDRSYDEDNVVVNQDIYFKPLIPLPDLVEVKTGEEDETPIYCQRAKLYRYEPQTLEWKERGIGDFKILKHKSKNRFRMVLRRDQILKIACNHYLTSSMILNPMNTSETAVCWVAIDFTEGNPIEEQFALKFKNKEILQKFVKLFNDCKTSLDDDHNNSYNGTDSNGSPTTTPTTTPTKFN